MTDPKMLSLAKWFKAAWSKIVAKGNRVDYEKADLLAQALKKIGGDVDYFKRFVWDCVGIRGEFAYSMATSFGVVDAETWLSIGWEGVRELVAVRTESSRSAVVSELKRRSAESGKTPSVRTLQRIIAKVAPKRERSSTLAVVPRPEHPAQTRDKLAADLLAVLNVYPKARALLSAETVKYLGLDVTPAAPAPKRPARSLVGAI